MVDDTDPTTDWWVPETQRTLCDLLILLEQPTEPVRPSDVVDLRSGALWRWGSGLTEGAVRPMFVSVPACRLLMISMRSRGSLPPYGRVCT